MDNEATQTAGLFSQQLLATGDAIVSSYGIIHRELTALILPVVHRQDVAEDLVSEFLLRELYAPVLIARAEWNTELLKQGYHHIHEEMKVFRTEQAFAQAQADRLPWSAKFHLEDRLLLLDLSTHLPEMEQRYLKGFLYNELEPEELAILLHVSPQRLRNLRDLCIIHLRKILSSAGKFTRQERSR